MAVTVLQEPSDISWSKSPVIVRLQTDQFAAANIIVGIDVTFTLRSGDSTTLRLTDYPDADHNVQFDLSAALDAWFLEFLRDQGKDYPEENLNEVLECTYSTGILNIVPFEIYGEPPAEHGDEVDDDPTDYIIVYGGMNFQQFKDNKYWDEDAWNLYPNNLFLTQHPGNMLVTKQMLHYLYYYWLGPDTGAGAAFIQMDVHLADGTIWSGPTITCTFEESKLYRIPCCFNLLNSIGSIVASNANVAKYVVYITDEFGSEIGFARTYWIDKRNAIGDRNITFRNSNGGFDSIRCTGEIEKITEAEHQTARKYFNPNNYEARNAMMVAYNHSTQRGFKLNTGWQSFAELDWLEELLNSPQIFLYDDIAGWLPIECTTKKITAKPDRSGLPSAELEFRYLFNNSVYTRNNLFE